MITQHLHLLRTAIGRTQPCFSHLEAEGGETQAAKQISRRLNDPSREIFTGGPVWESRCRRFRLHFGLTRAC